MGLYELLGPLCSPEQQGLSFLLADLEMILLQWPVHDDPGGRELLHLEFLRVRSQDLGPGCCEPREPLARS